MTPHCPHCKTDLSYIKDGQTYSRMIGVEIRGVYDGVLYWQCPDCGGKWHRWEPGTYQRERADRYIA